MSDSEKKLSRGGRNPHLATSEKRACSKCSQRVDHYADGTITKHKVYKIKVVSGKNVRTSTWHYCDNTHWR